MTETTQTESGISTTSTRKRLPRPEVLLGKSVGTMTAVDVGPLNGDKRRTLIVSCSCSVHNGAKLPRPVPVRKFVKGYRCQGNAANSDEEQFYISCWKHCVTVATKSQHSGFLDYRDYLVVCRMPCAVCGSIDSRSRAGRTFPLNTVDRINHTIGYVPDNCQPLCHKHNMIKGQFDKLLGSKKIATFGGYKMSVTDVTVDVFDTFELTARGYGHHVRIVPDNGDDWRESW